MRHLLLALLIMCAPAFAQKVYWLDYGADIIYRADLDGSNSEQLVTSGLSLPLGIALDAAAGKMYWSDAFGISIRRANLDGTNLETLVTGISNIDTITLDLVADKIYWCEEAGNIQRSNLDGSNLEPLLSGLAIPVGITLDVGSGKMYWTELTGRVIQRANLDGTNRELLASGLGTPMHIALDLPSGKMYWCDRNGRVRRANTDGSNIEDLITMGLDRPSGIALDLAVGKIYFASQGGEVHRANLDGTGIELLFNGASNWGIALDLVPPPSCSVVAPAPMATVTGDVSLTFDADDPMGTPLSSSLDYSTDGGATWAPMTPAPGSTVANPDPARPTPITGVAFLWDSAGDAVGQSMPVATLLRVTVDSGTLLSTCEVGVTVDNTQLCNGICGDCDLGGTGPTILDALAGAQMATGLLVPTMAQEGCCDVDSSGSITVLDALGMAQAAAGLPVMLSCP